MFLIWILNKSYLKVIKVHFIKNLELANFEIKRDNIAHVKDESAKVSCVE